MPIGVGRLPIERPVFHPIRNVHAKVQAFQIRHGREGHCLKEARHASNEWELDGLRLVCLGSRETHDDTVHVERSKQDVCNEKSDMTDVPAKCLHRFESVGASVTLEVAHEVDFPVESWFTEGFEVFVDQHEGADLRVGEDVDQIGD